MKAWYNEIDPFKAEVLREAIKAGAIAPGDVDERSITDVRPAELVGYTQCHFFAGGGFWNLALRQAGWPDWRPCWTGSCPCPSFSEAGKGEGFDDDRHLWPVWDTLIGECRPPVIFGEQAHAAIGFGWLDLVCGNLEAKGYAVAPAVLGAHSVGAPHRRQRLYFVAHTASERHDRRRPSQAGYGIEAAERSGIECQPERLCDACRHPHICKWNGCQVGASTDPDGGNSSAEADGRERRLELEPNRDYIIAGDSEIIWSSNTEERGLAMRGGEPGNAGHAAQPSESGVDLDAKREGLEGHFGDVRDWRGPGWLDPLTARSVAEAGATRGFWADCDWWYGRDEKYRPIGPGLFPLATGSTARVGRLRMYGDAIVVPQAQALIEAYIEVMAEKRIGAEAPMFNVVEISRIPGTTLVAPPCPEESRSDGTA